MPSSSQNSKLVKGAKPIRNRAVATAMEQTIKPTAQDVGAPHHIGVTMDTTATAMESPTALTMAYQAQKKSWFFNKIPGEIRHKIYEHLLIASGDVLIQHDPERANKHHHGSCTQHRSEVAQGPHAAIVQTCRLTVYETYPILYGRNIFCFHRRQDIDQFQFSGIRLTTSKVSESWWQRGLMKRTWFGTDMIAGKAGRLSLVRQVCLPEMINDGRGLMEPSWGGLNKFPALEHLVLDIGANVYKREDVDSDDEDPWLASLVQKHPWSEIVARRLGISCGCYKGELAGLRKLTIRDLPENSFPMEYEGWSFLEWLQENLRPGIELVVNGKKVELARQDR